MRFAFLSCLVTLPLILAAPAPGSPTDADLKNALKTNNKALCGKIPPLTLPAGVAVPAGQTIRLATLGRGNQNYTCTAGAYVSAGAVAELFDISCILSNPPFFVPKDTDLPTLLPTLALNYLSYPINVPFVKPVIDHHFIGTPDSTNPSAISPGFFSVTKAAQAVVGKAGSANAPIDPGTNVPWLQLAALPGFDSLAKTVLRVYTAGGQPPASCNTEGEKLSVEYAALYYFAS